MSQAIMDEIKELRKDQDRFAGMLKAANKPQRNRSEVYFGRSHSNYIPDEQGQWGYKSFAHFAHDVREHCDNQSALEKKIQPFAHKYYERFGKAATGQNESLLTDGGVLVPPEFASQILERVHANEAVDLQSMTDQYTVSGNQMKLPALDEDSRADGSRHGGILAYWDNEGAQIQASKAKFDQISLNLNRLTCMAFTTQELRDDSATALETYLTRKCGDAIRFKVGDAITNGDGSQRPLGYLQSPAKVTQAAVSGQGAGTIVHANVVNMFARMPASSMSKAVWLANQDTLPALWSMFLATGDTGTPVLLPPGGISGSPYWTMMGRPIILTEWAATLGTEGDLAFVDLGQYITISKGSIDSAMSIHLRFDYAEEAFRFIFRIDGRPWNKAPLTPFKGSVTQSPIVTLNSTRT